MAHLIRQVLCSISSARIAFYFSFFSLFLLGTMVCAQIKKTHRWDQLDQKIEEITLLTQKEILKKNAYDSLSAFYQKSNHHYLQEQLEPLVLLREEESALHTLLSAPGFCGDKNLEKRLLFLSSGDNKIKLEEQLLYNSPHYKEIEVRFTSPVETSLEDLEKILQKIEANDPIKPLIQITHFTLDRVAPINQGEIFKINLTILKREFLES